MQIAILGAGAVGCYIGGRLANAGADIVLIGREKQRDMVLANGLRLTDYKGFDATVSPRFETDIGAAREADFALVCVKSRDTADVAHQLRATLKPSTVVVSFQNGVSNAGTIADVSGASAVPGMVGFNVAAEGTRFHQGTQGDLHLADTRDTRALADVLRKCGLSVHLHDDMTPVLWAKLMLNLNNAVNALSGLPLRDQLSRRAYRECLAMAQDELLTLCEQANQPLAKLTPLPPRMLPRVLRLPNPLFRTIAGSMLRIDPRARSSMADDLALGRPTEIDWINGEVVRLAKRLGRDAPVNATLVNLVHEESQSRTSSSASALKDKLSRAA